MILNEWKEKDAPLLRIFQEDLMHYTAKTQKWFADFLWEEVFGKKILV